jgi:hypothetical protein
MRVHLLFFVSAFDADVATDGAPTFDPEEPEFALMDEYMTDADRPEARFLQYLVNETGNLTIVPPPQTEQGIPILPLALVGLLGAGMAGYFMTRTGYTYETHDFDHAADSGLLDHPDYDLEYDDGDDHDYDSE